MKTLAAVLLKTKEMFVRILAFSYILTFPYKCYFRVVNILILKIAKNLKS